MNIIRFFIGLLLIPLCLAVTRTAVSLIGVIWPSASYAVPLSGLALGGGFLLWIFLYLALPRPARVYVLAHELTHALWGMLMGAKLFRIRVRKNSGAVTLSKVNFLIALAPYFFPLYTVLVILVYYALSVFMDMRAYYSCWLGLVGFTWGFHLTLTISTLLEQQSDIQKYGRLFSYAIIYIFNVFGICLWVAVISSATFGQTARFLYDHAVDSVLLFYGWFERIMDWMNQRIEAGT